MTGAGGAAFPWIVQHFKAKGVRVLAADMDALAPGLFLADKGFVIPGGNDPAFGPAILQICREEEVDAVFPLVDEELLTVARLGSEIGVVMLPETAFIETCLDKYILMEQLAKHGIPIPKTRLASEGVADLKWPLVVKPRTGRGSRDVHIVSGTSELDAILSDTTYELDALLIQECIAGAEFTVSVVAWKDGITQVVVPKEILCKRGITKLAVTRANQAINDVCRKVQDCLRPDGPINVQLMLEANSGVPRIFEINPRYSTSTTLTVQSGVEEMYGLLLQAVNGPEAFTFGDFEKDVVMVRSSLDQFMSEADFLGRELIYLNGK